MPSSMTEAGKKEFKRQKFNTNVRSETEKLTMEDINLLWRISLAIASR